MGKKIPFLFFLMLLMTEGSTQPFDTKGLEGPEKVSIPIHPSQREGQRKKGNEKEVGVPARAQEILDFWFGPLKALSSDPRDKKIVWFSDDPDFDRQIRSRYEEDMRQALLGKLDHWRHTPEGRLALILLLDQFPRHIYSNQKNEFAFDSMARALVIEGLQLGDDKKLFPIERIFFYMPLQHSEDLNNQNLSVRLYAQLVNESSPIIRPQMESYLRNAILSKQTIARFKRFPSRNKILGREPTPEEMIYLNQPEIKQDAIR